MATRDRNEKHRASTPLELLLDLSFVVAVAQVAAELHHGISSGHFSGSLMGYGMVFFAVWWAWMNFTWFASSYDVDDLPYRMLTLLQIAGVLVLATGVPKAFEYGQFAIITVGYGLMRVALVLQWLRVARNDPADRPLALRYAVCIGLLQLGWFSRLLLPDAFGPFTFIVLICLELAVPPFAERGTANPGWHPGHIAERYGLFTLIVLGESILAATTAVQAAQTSGGLSWQLAGVAGGGLLLIFGLWWTYFAHPADDALRNEPRLAFLWGYGHYFVFSSAAAVGAGLQVAADAIRADERADEIQPMVASLAVAVPVALYLLALGILQSRLDRAHSLLVRSAMTAAGVVAIGFAGGALGLATAVLLIGLIVLGSAISADQPAVLDDSVTV